MALPVSAAAARRLARDLAELACEPIPGIAAAPVDSSLFLWHANLCPVEGPYMGLVFHVALEFPHEYPAAPPAVRVLNWLAHPNVFHSSAPGDDPAPGRLCLDMLGPAWSTAYTGGMVLAQIASFLFVEWVEQDDGPTRGVGQAVAGLRSGRTLVSTVRPTRHAFDVQQTREHIGWFECAECGHTAAAPVPPLPAGDEPRDLGPAAPHARVLSEEPALARVRVRQAAALLNAMPARLLTQLLDGLAPRTICTLAHMLPQLGAFVRASGVLAASQSRCYFSKVTADEDVLGFGALLRWHTRGDGSRAPALASASSALELLSWSAFCDSGVRRTVDGSGSFDAFVPLWIGRSAQRALGVLREMLPRAFPTETFSPPLALRYYACASVSLIVELVAAYSGSSSSASAAALASTATAAGTSARASAVTPRHLSSRALDGYHQLQVTIAALLVAFPTLVASLDALVEAFVSSERGRTKTAVPSLGELVVLLPFARAGWAAVWQPLLLEHFARGVRWLVRDHPELARTDARHPDRLARTFCSQLTGTRLIVLQLAFAESARACSAAAASGDPLGSLTVAQRNAWLVDMADSGVQRLGLASEAQQETLFAAAQHAMSLNSYPAMFRAMRVPVPTRDLLEQLLEDAVLVSAERGYHDAPGRRARG